MPGERAAQVERRTARRRWLRWLLPELALVASLFTVFYCLIPYDGPRELFRDSSTGWHIITGQKILEQGRVPRTDPYSFGRSGKQWFAWDWGADCILGWIERDGGLTGVAWIFAIAIAVVTWLWFRLNWAVNGNLLLACLIFPVMLAASRVFWTATPHVFGWMLMLIGLRLLENAAEREYEAPDHVFGFRLKHALRFGLMAAFWVNFEASFWFLPVAAAIYAIGHLFRPFIWNLDQSIERRMARGYTWAAVFALAGTFVNPYGLRPHLHAIESFFVGGSNLMSGPAMLLAMGIAALGAVLALGQKKLSHFLLAALLLAGAFGLTRMVGMTAIVLLPLANGSITDALRRAHDIRPNLRARVHALLLFSDRLRLIDGRLRGMWLAWVATAATLLWLLIPNIDAHTGFAPGQFPVYAAGELARLPATARLLTPVNYSGYVIYRYRGERRVLLS